VLALLAVRTLCGRVGWISYFFPQEAASGKYGHVERADLEQCPSFTSAKSGPIGDHAPAVFPSPAEDDGADAVWDVESEWHLCFLGGSSVC